MNGGVGFTGHEGVGVAHSRGDEPDTNLAGARFGKGIVGDVQLFTEVLDDGGGHGAHNLSLISAARAATGRCTSDASHARVASPLHAGHESGSLRRIRREDSQRGVDDLLVIGSLGQLEVPPQLLRSAIG